MDRLVKPEANEVELMFYKGQKSTTSFKLTNLMHTMSVAVSLTTTNPSVLSLNKLFSIIPPLSSASYTLQLSHPSDHPPLSDPPDVITVRTSMLPTGKAHADDLRRLFSKPGPHVFRDAVITVSLVGPHVAEFLLSHHPERSNLFTKAISGCSKSELTKLLKPAVERGDTDSVADLLAAGGDANGQSLIPLAIRAGKLELVKLLVSSGCGINNSVDLVLHEAAAMDRIDLVEFSFESFGDKIDVNSVNPKGRTPIHVAAMEGHVRVIEFFVSKGGNPNGVDSEGWTPLHCAASRGHLKAVECLLECSNVKYVRNREGKTAFDVAAESGHTRLLDSLHWGDALLRAARIDDVHGMKRCLGEGAAVNRKDQNGWTPLHWAAFKGRIKSVKLLLEHGAEVDTVDDAGYTPLHCAAEAGHLQVALLLIAHGGSQISLKTFQHVAPLNLDSFHKHVSLDYESKSIA
ncbi:Major sperm protein [Sesbania bispinosa]|nr:Major sperm protein [Sesbania bispinosa]